MAEIVLSECPLHRSVVSEKKVLREGKREKYIAADGSVREYRVSKIVRHVVFCPVCRDLLAKDGEKFADLAIGFADATEADAARIWNAAVCKHTIRIFNDAVKGTK